MADLKLIKAYPTCKHFQDKDGVDLILMLDVRLSYAFLGEAADDTDDDGNPTPAWRSNFLLPKETHQDTHDLIERIIARLCKDNGNAKVQADKLFMTDGDDKEDEHSQGHWIVVAKDSKNRPKCRNHKKEVMEDPEEIDKMLYSGAWGHALIRPWFFGGKVKNKPKTYPKRVSCGLNAVMFSRNDTPFGKGRIDDTDAWGSVPESTAPANMDDDGDDEL